MSTNGSTTNPHADPEKCMSIIQSHTAGVTLHYLTEGNANIIYSIAPITLSAVVDNASSSDDEAALHDHCCVLRMRKDLPTTRPCAKNLRAIRESVMPLFQLEFTHNLMPQALYVLNEGLLAQVEGVLAELDDARSSPMGGMDDGVAVTIARGRTKRGIGGHPPLAAEPHAILMPNLRYGEGYSRSLFREFKPKWLLQSVSAPRDARRCRTCAVNALKREQGKKKGKGDGGFCPLNLISEDAEIVTEVVGRIVGDDAQKKGGPRLVEEFVRKVQPVLRCLKILQGQFGTGQIADVESDVAEEGGDLAVAMALRDCSVFLVLAEDEDGQLKIVDVKLADLDLKILSTANREKWARMEAELCSSGAYTDATMSGSNCALERS